MRTVHYELLRPTEIVAERDRCPVAYLPIGPLEWHSLHMPLGTDGLNAGAVAERVAQRVGGVVLPTFFWGTERERPEGMVADLGFAKGSYVVGMDFPANILPSLYCREEFLALLVRELLGLLVRQQYKLIVMVNGHGARNHLDTLQRLAVEFSAPSPEGPSPARVILATAWPSKGDLDTFTGHADAGETSVMMALAPDSVDVSALPQTSEPLRSRDWAVVDSDTFNGKPTPEHTLRPEYDPRTRSTPEKGQRILSMAVEDVEGAVREAMAALGLS
jgi:creatinine amidohydrolase